MSYFLPNFFKNIFKNENFDYNTLETGDLLLYSTNTWYSKLIRFFGNSTYSHIAIILKNPTWIDEKLTEPYYILESGGEDIPDAVSGEYIFGVQIVPLSKIIEQYKESNLGKLFIRKLKTDRNESFYKKIKEAYNIAKNKKYDINPENWILAAYEVDNYENFENLSGSQIQKYYQKTNEFWCSALVSFIFAKIGLLPENIPWTLVSPHDFSYFEDKKFKFQNCELEPEFEII